MPRLLLCFIVITTVSFGSTYSGIHDQPSSKYAPGATDNTSVINNTGITGKVTDIVVVDQVADSTSGSGSGFSSHLADNNNNFFLESFPAFKPVTMLVIFNDTKEGDNCPGNDFVRVDPDSCNGNGFSKCIDNFLYTFCCPDSTIYNPMLRRCASEAGLNTFVERVRL